MSRSNSPVPVEGPDTPDALPKPGMKKNSSAISLASRSSFRVSQTGRRRSSVSPKKRRSSSTVAPLPNRLPTEMADVPVNVQTTTVPATEQEYKPVVKMHYAKEDGAKTSEEGGLYIGERKDGVYHGEGTLTTPEGGEYRGQWVEGKKHGRGQYSFPDGATYFGNWKQGVPHGEGRYTWPGGEYYDGNYCYGKREGYGTMQYRVDGKTGDRYEGFWHQGYKEGRGRMTYGQVVSGKDLLTSTEPYDKYTGEFRKGYRHGKGVYTFKDGSSFQGCYKYGVRHGLGVFFFKESFISAKHSMKEEEGESLVSAYISEWCDGEELEDVGVHTKISEKGAN